MFWKYILSTVKMAESQLRAPFRDPFLRIFFMDGMMVRKELENDQGERTLRMLSPGHIIPGEYNYQRASCQGMGLGP